MVGFVSLGCVKNLVDSEKMLAQIAEAGALIGGDEAAADTIVVNTCGFLQAARAEVLEVLEELAARKRRGQATRWTGAMSSGPHPAGTRGDPCPWATATLA